MIWTVYGLAAYLVSATIIFLCLNGVIYPNWSLRAALSKNDETLELFLLSFAWPVILVSIVFLWLARLIAHPFTLR